MDVGWNLWLFTELYHWQLRTNECMHPCIHESMHTEDKQENSQHFHIRHFDFREGVNGLAFAYCE